MIGLLLMVGLLLLKIGLARSELALSSNELVSIESLGGENGLDFEFSLNGER